MFRKIFKVSSLCFLGLTLMSCAHIFCKSQGNLSVFISPMDSDRTHFSGKGAGAGMMLSSSMGPMGIAIGIAIDEGIAKDIHETAQKAGLNFGKLFRESITQQALQHKMGLDFSSDKGSVDYVIWIEEYGFISQPGEDDPVSARIHLKIKSSLHDQSSPAVVDLHYPEDFLGEEDDLLLRSLERVKTDPGVIEELWRHALIRISNKAIQNFQLHKASAI